MRDPLTWRELRALGKTDNAGRWYPTDPTAEEYIAQGAYRAPSRAWPNSYAKACMTRKFIRWLTTNHPKHRILPND